MSLLTGLTLLFAAAKLFGYTDASWWWVFSPYWAGVPIVAVMLALIDVAEDRL